MPQQNEEQRQARKFAAHNVAYWLNHGEYARALAGASEYAVRFAGSDEAGAYIGLKLKLIEVLDHGRDFCLTSYVDKFESIAKSLELK